MEQTFTAIIASVPGLSVSIYYVLVLQRWDTLKCSLPCTIKTGKRTGSSHSVTEQVFSRAVSAVGTERGGTGKHHGRSVQQETGEALATEKRFRRLAIPRGVH